MNKNCKHCLWYSCCEYVGECDGDGCECYEPADEEEADRIASEEYEDDLRIRQDIYMEQVGEQDG
jgi:hypothetical protein